MKLGKQNLAALLLISQSTQRSDAIDPIIIKGMIKGALCNILSEPVSQIFLHKEDRPKGLGEKILDNIVPTKAYVSSALANGLATAIMEHFAKTPSTLIINKSVSMAKPVFSNHLIKNIAKKNDLPDALSTGLGYAAFWATVAIESRQPQRTAKAVAGFIVGNHLLQMMKQNAPTPVALAATTGYLNDSTKLPDKAYEIGKKDPSKWGEKLEDHYYDGRAYHVPLN